MNCIYSIFDKLSNDCLYVGQTKRDNPETRWKEHQRDIKNQKHKIKKLNTSNDEDIRFEVICTLETDNSLILSMAECLYNSLLHPLNRVCYRDLEVTQLL